ncbi:MAG TPA: hypothetical protein VN756_04050 [Solirubrobacterales bacterium]|nr:hypothetical protein [Solirubrobacterales bacterium]
MRGVSKTLIAAIAALLLAMGLVACGGGDDSSSTATDAAAQVQAEGKPSEGGSSEDNGDSGGESGSSNNVDDQSGDSGGGSAQFKTKGGDNSVQEFGEEADADELDAAAETLHGFLDARAAGDWEAACSYISKSVTESFEKLAAQAEKIEDLTCDGLLENLTNPVAMQALQDEAEKANVGSLRIEDESAFIIYTGVDGTVLAMPMANEDGTWKVAALAGTPLS